MVETKSEMLPIGTKAPDFSLPDVGGKTVSLSDVSDGKALLVIFMCNHCPFVIHIRDGLVEMVKDLQGKGVNVVAINANDVPNYPDDSPQRMKEDAEKYGYTFFYLYDESQEVAKAYAAACTPDFFLFDQDSKLVYRGQMDGARPGNNVPVNGNDLRAAVDAVLNGQLVSDNQMPSIGCNIKWKAGNAPDYFG